MKKNKTKVVLHHWAWARTDKDEIIVIDETRKIVANERQYFLHPELNPAKAIFPKEVNLQTGKLLRKLYRKTKIVPVTITYYL